MADRLTFYNLPPDVQEAYAGLDDASKQYPLEMDGKVIRFKANLPVKFCVDHINLNDLWKEASRNDWPGEDLRQFYREMGYSLCGFLEIFDA